MRPTLIPEEPHLRNYVSLFVDFDFARHFLNSAFIAVMCTQPRHLVPGIAGRFRLRQVHLPAKELPLPGPARLNDGAALHYFHPALSCW